jgi:hypothetical protein
MGFSFVVDETNQMRSARETSRRNGFVSVHALYRPAGTREALPGAIAGLTPRGAAPQRRNKTDIEVYVEIFRKSLSDVLRMTQRKS